jgi:hypothetical protein
MTPELPDPSGVLEWSHWNYKSHLARRLLAAQVVWTLKTGGPLEGDDTMTVLADRLRSRGVDLSGVSRIALSGLTAVLAHQGNLTALTDVPLLRRRVHGRRTVHLSVLDGVLPPDPFGRSTVPAAESVAPTVEPDAVTDAPPRQNGHKNTRPASVASLEDKAMLVLRLAGELALDIAALPPTPTSDGGRLAETLTESHRLRQQLDDERARRREAEEQLASQKRVNAALKAQADILQNNLDAHMRYERRPEETGRRALDRLMREPVHAR